MRFGEPASSSPRLAAADRLHDPCSMGDCLICPGWAIGCGCECHYEEDGWL